jgi:hypothetical protein
LSIGIVWINLKKLNLIIWMNLQEDEFDNLNESLRS